MDRAVELARFNQPGVVLGAGAPFGIAGVQVEQPQLTAQEALAPVRPGFAGEIPAPAGGVYGETVVVRLDQPAELAGGEVKESWSICLWGWHNLILLRYRRMWERGVV